MTQLEPVPVEQPSSFPSSEQIHRTMNFSTLEGSVTQIFLNWTTGSVLTGLMLHYHATAFELAMVASVPLLAQSASPFAAYLAGLFGRRKQLMILLALVGRGCWILAAFLPWLGIPDALKPLFLVILVAFSSVFQAASGTLWAGLMGDLVPGEERGKYFGYRTGLSGVVGMLGNLVAGYILDRLEAPLNFQMVLFISVVLSLIGIALYTTHVEPPPPKRENMKKVLLEPWQDLNFRRLLRFALFWQASVLLAAPFVFTYFIQELGLSFTKMGLGGKPTDLSVGCRTQVSDQAR
jgi:MFS family permease